MAKYEDLLAEVRRKYPKYTVKLRHESFFTRYWGPHFSTTIGNTTYVPETFGTQSDESRWALIRHEATHTDQIHTWPLGPKVPWLNYLIFGFCYLLVLPVLFTFRSKFEREGYTETLIALGSLNQLATPEAIEAEAQRVAGEFYRSAYLWMWWQGPALEWARATATAASTGLLRSRWTA